MKHLLTLALLTFPLLAPAKKNVCKDLVHRTDKMRDYITISSPNGTAVVSKWIKGTDTSYNLILVIFEKSNIPVIAGSEATQTDKGVYLQFDDGSVYREENAAVTAALIASRLGYTATITIDEKLKGQIIAHKLVKLGLGSRTKEVPEVTGGRLGGFLECLYQ